MRCIMVSDDTQEKLRAVRVKVEEVGQKMGIPFEQAAVLVAIHEAKKPSGLGRLWAWGKGVMSYASKTADKIHID